MMRVRDRPTPISAAMKQTVQNNCVTTKKAEGKFKKETSLLPLITIHYKLQFGLVVVVVGGPVGSLVIVLYQNFIKQEQMGTIFGQDEENIHYNVKEG